MHKTSMLMAAACLALTGCARSTVTDLNTREFMVSTAAAPVCGTRGAREVVTKMAAVEVLRKGFIYYYITGGSSDNNVTAIPGAPVYVPAAGGGGYYGGGPIIMGTNDADLRVVMVHKGEPGSERALDARKILGPDWKTIAAKGIKTC